MSAKAIPETLARHLQKGRAERALQVGRESINEEARTAVLAFASEEPYERFWGVEILAIEQKSMRAGRLKAGANLLCDHDTKDVVGVVESVEVGADKVARAVVRFGKSARAEEVWQDVRDGIRRNVSVGYVIHKAQLVETKDGLETYRVTDWEPLEVSLVSVPADATVGVGRSLEEPAVPTSSPIKEIPMTTEVNVAGTAAPEVKAPAQRNHAEDISKAAAAIPGGAELAMSAIQRGLTLEQFQREAIEKMATKPLPTADIGLTKTEQKRYSFVRAMNALANPKDAAAQNAAAFEIECSRAAADKSGKATSGVIVPYDVLKRDLLVGTATAGGNLVATELRDFIDLLRNAMVISGMGTRFMTGLVGNIAIPKLSGAATAYWVAENGSPTESAQTFAQVPMTPKTVGAFTDISRRLLLQSSIDVENLVQQDLAMVIGLAIQAAAINGSGAANEPTGILNTTGIGDVAGGVNGAAPTWANIIELETDVAVANADVGTLAYLTNAKVRGKLKGTEKFSTTGNVVWADGSTPLNGYRAAVTNAVPSNLTKGTAAGIASAILFGNFADLMIGMWGGLDLQVDPYTGGTSGAVRVRVLQDVDVAIRHAESFSAMKDALTA